MSEYSEGLGEAIAPGYVVVSEQSGYELVHESPGYLVVRIAEDID